VLRVIVQHLGEAWKRLVDAGPEGMFGLTLKDLKNLQRSALWKTSRTRTKE
jgi:hypothetical protein